MEDEGFRAITASPPEASEPSRGATAFASRAKAAAAAMSTAAAASVRHGGASTLLKPGNSADSSESTVATDISASGVP